MKNYYENTDLWNKDLSTEEEQRINTVVSLMPDDIESLLDAGCGNGILAKHLHSTKSTMKRIHSLDFSNAALNYVQGEKSLGSIDKMNFTDNEFDLVTCLEVLEHLEEKTYHNAIKDISRVAKKYIIVSVPNNEKLERRFINCPKCKSHFHFTNHLRSFSIKEVINLFDEYGFSNERIELNGISMNFKFISEIKRAIKGNSKQLKHNHIVHCPVCGHIIKPNTTRIKTTDSTKKSKNLNIIQDIWPKNYNYNWIIAVFANRTKFD